MSESQARTRRKSKTPYDSHQAATGAGPTRAPDVAPSSQLGPYYGAGPVMGLGSPVQTKLAIGQAGDAYEQEADAVAHRVTAGGSLAPPALAAPSLNTVARAGADEKKPEQKAVQKADTPKPAEKKPEEKAVQKADAPKSGEKKPEEKTVQKAGASQPGEKKPEQKAVQKADAPKREEKKPEQTAVQKAEAPKAGEKKPEEKTVQKADAATPEKPREQKPVQKSERQAAGGGAPDQGASPVTAAEQAIAHAGPGRPMNEQTRDALETRMHRDLKHVRVHDDDAAHEAARDVHARAFTHGHDIWLGRGESDSDLGLMAHEATHVVQQSGEGGLQRMMLQRKASAAPVAGGSPATAESGTPGERQKTTRQSQPIIQRDTPAAGGKPDPSKTGLVDKAKKTISIPEIQLPTFKTRRHKDLYTSPLTVPKAKKAPPGEASAPGGKKAARDTRQIQKFRDAVQAGVDGAVEAKLKGKENQAVQSGTSGQRIYFLKSKSAKFYLFGSVAGLQSEARVPYWDREGKERLLEVDHKREIQLGGEDEPDNYELLDSDANWSSGISIRSEIIKRIKDAVAPYSGPDAAQKIWPQPPNVDTVQTQYEITYEKVRGGLKLSPGGEPDQYWGLTEIQKGDHLKKLDVMTEKQINAAGLLGSDKELVIYTAAHGGTPRRIAWEGTTEKDINKPNFYKGFNLKTVHYEPNDAEGAKVGWIRGDVFEKGKVIKKTTLTWPIRKAPGIGYGGYIDDEGVLAKINKQIELNALSPIEFRRALVDDAKGLVAVGQVLPSVPLIRDAGIDLVIEGDDVRLRKVFNTGEFSFPRPITVTDSSLELSLGISTGLGIRGDVQFEIERVGKGKLGASASTGTAAGEQRFEIEGEFNFDSKLFDEAKIEAWYKNDAFGARGKLAINKEGKIKGIKSASAEASYIEGKLEASGKAELSVPGVKSVNLAMSYSEKEGLAIGGSFELADNIPGIKSGSGQAQIKQKPGGEGYDVTASGKAVPKIPGVDATLAVAYDNGAITVEGTAAYEKGMLKGSILLGATNRPVDADGKPGGEPTKKLTAYGGGSVTIRIAPWLQGTIGVRLLPNGEIEVSGSVGLPSSLNIFPEKKLSKNIFSINIDIPIVGVSAAGQRVGIFATIGGGLDLSAGIGPGQLQDLGLSVTYNPAHEDQTHVTGTAKLHIPAYAGLRLFVKGGLGAGIPLVSAEAGVEIGGQLGLDGALDAGVQVDWTPTSGLKLDAFGEIYVEPKMKFDITAYVKVELDLLLTTIDLYSHRWELAAFEFGSGLRLGVKFPIHYEEGKPFDISLSDVQFQIPNIEPKQILSDLMKKIV